ncbi:hypothetical protein [Achromobacter insuavis]|uniref:hypothetical protein n=1 Tax=Achromobacter insuavis TaxID=1287735 RepID=UPI001F12E0B0|nr:hypothetical protein [Achromobacter insuavis]
MTFNPWIVRPLPSRAEEQKERARKRKQEREMQRQAYELRGYKNQIRPDTSQDARRERLSRENVERRETILAALEGRTFRAWYEATTGEPVTEFLAEVLLTPEQFESRYTRLSWQRDYLGWLEARIERIANDNPWKNPEMVGYWAKAIQECTEPRERRRLLLRLATPAWADRKKIRAIYDERDRIELETGVPHDVDHVVPLVNTLVCGLHCEANLRIVPAAVNRSKSNKFDPDLSHDA